MNQLLVGYTRVSTEHQDLTAQRNSLAALGVGDDRIHVDHGLTGTNRDRPGLRLAEAACHSGDTVVVTKLDRLARSLPDARDILTELTQSSRGVSTPVREGLLRRRRGVASRFPSCAGRPSSARSRAVAPRSYLDGREQGPRERSAGAGAGARKRTLQRAPARKEPPDGRSCLTSRAQPPFSEVAMPMGDTVQQLTRGTSR
jgi:hypothetical protein